MNKMNVGDMFIWKLLSLRVCRPAAKRVEPSCLIYFRFKPWLNWKSWITLTPLVQDGLLQLKAAFSFLSFSLKKSYRNYFFLTDGWPGQSTKGIAKGGQHWGTTKLVLSARHYPSHVQQLSSAQWAWLNIWSTVSGLTSLAKLHLPGRKRYAFEQGNASLKMLRK